MERMRSDLLGRLADLVRDLTDKPPGEWIRRRLGSAIVVSLVTFPPSSSHLSFFGRGAAGAGATAGETDGNGEMPLAEMRCASSAIRTNSESSAKSRRTSASRATHGNLLRSLIGRKELKDMAT